MRLNIPLVLVSAIFAISCGNAKLTNTTKYEGKRGAALAPDSREGQIQSARVNLDDNLRDRIVFKHNGEAVDLAEVISLTLEIGHFTERLIDDYAHVPDGRHPFVGDNAIIGESSRARLRLGNVQYDIIVSPKGELVRLWMGRDIGPIANSNVDLVVMLDGFDLSEFDHEVIFRLIGEPIQKRRVLSK